MNALLQAAGTTLDHGGPVVWIILALAVLLYSRCLGLLFHLIRVRRGISQAWTSGSASRRDLRALRDDLEESFQRQRTALAAMIAAAPLLGLLGTVTGMIQTFRHLAKGGSAEISGGLADGISEALIATAAGLGVAIPGVLLLYAAHRQLQRVWQVTAQPGPESNPAL